jgi:hypothetical protein
MNVGPVCLFPGMPCRACRRRHGPHRLTATTRPVLKRGVLIDMARRPKDPRNSKQRKGSHVALDTTRLDCMIWNGKELVRCWMTIAIDPDTKIVIAHGISTEPRHGTLKKVFTNDETGPQTRGEAPP